MARKIYHGVVLQWGFALLLAGLISVAGAEAGASTEKKVSLRNSIREIVAAAKAGQLSPRQAQITRTDLNAAESAAPMDFQVALKMRNFAELQARVARGERISPAELAAKYQPTAADYRKVTTWLTGHGFTITHRDPNHLSVFARAKVGLIAQALQTRFARVAFRGQEFTSAVTAPNVPASISPLLVGINGLQPQFHPRKSVVARPNDLTSTNPPYTPAQVAKAYGVDGLYTSGLTGANETIAIVIDNFPQQSDLTTFWSTYGINQSLSNISFIQVVPGSFDLDTTESSLDVEWSSSIAPAAKIRIYASTSLNTTLLAQAYEQVYTDAVTYGIHQMSLSFGGGETDASGSVIASDTQYFTELAAVGVTIFASSGDAGSTPNPGSASNDTSGPLQVEWPADNPYVTAVGGTTLHLNTNGTINSESAWGNLIGGSGGGTSIYFNRPTWQTGSGVPAGSMRLLPDISAVADPLTPAVLNYTVPTEENGVIVPKSSTAPVGGTSWSSPTWAGFCALINQSRANASLGTIGLLGPQLYRLIGTNNFRDIVTGSNAVGVAANGNYSATIGYDQVTGIGSPQMQNLVATLTNAALPTVTIAPASRNLVPGATTTFTVTASGTPTGYQWQRLPIGGSSWASLTNTGFYTGTTTATLTITAAPTAMSGDQFRCIVSYAGGIQVNSLTTSALVVEPPLVIAAFAGQVGVTGTSNGTGSSAQFSYPSGVALDNSGNLYIADFLNNQIRKVTPQRVVTTPYGAVNAAQGSVDGIGNAARFFQPNAVVFDGTDALYVADTGNNLIRKIVLSTGQVTTIGGHPASANQPGVADYYDGDGSTVAAFNQPNGIALSSGILYIADTYNNAVRKIVLSTGQVSSLTALTPAPSGTLHYLSNSGYRDGGGNVALVAFPNGLASDASGNIYLADMANNVVRKITPAGVFSTYAGQAGTQGYVDGPAASAQFNAPNGVATDAAGNVYVTDANLLGTDIGNDLLRKISPNGVVSTPAGQAGSQGNSLGTGSAVQFYGLQALAQNIFGGFYVLDTFNQVIRRAGYAPGISTPPLGQVIAVGSPVTFSVTPSGTGAFTYQWSKNGSSIGGATNATYTIASVASGDAGNYSVTVTSPYGNITSSNATLIPVAAQPVAQTVESGQPVTFTVTPSGSGPFTYQWYFNGIAISGATGSSYTIPVTGSSNAGNYTVTITDSDGVATTLPASLTVNVFGSDTPVLPTWALLLLAGLLYIVAIRSLPDKRRVQASR